MQRNWVGQVFATSYSSFSRGVAILVSKNTAFRSHRRVKDDLGSYVIFKGVLSGKDVTSMNLYCPQDYSPDFLSKVFAEFSELATGDSFVGGDFTISIPPFINFRLAFLPLHGKLRYSLLYVMILDIQMHEGSFTPLIQSLLFFLPPIKVIPGLTIFSSLHQKCFWLILSLRTGYCQGTGGFNPLASEMTISSPTSPLNLKCFIQLTHHLLITPLPFGRHVKHIPVD